MSADIMLTVDELFITHDIFVLNCSKLADFTSCQSAKDFVTVLSLKANYFVPLTCCVFLLCCVYLTLFVPSYRT